MNDRANNPKKNAEGYSDMTPHNAVKNVERQNERMRVSKLVRTIFYICNLAGFEVVNRIELKDRKTGKIWR